VGTCGPLAAALRYAASLPGIAFGESCCARQRETLELTSRHQGISKIATTEGRRISVETERARWRGEEPYSRTATTPDEGIAKVSAERHRPSADPRVACG
jgi:hypothetical protein